MALFARRYGTDNTDLIIYLTRKDDSSVSLQARCDKANDLKADAFVSIHCNSREKQGFYGLEIEAFHLSGSKKGKHLASCLLESLYKTYQSMMEGISMGVYNRGVKEFGYYVLRETKMPAALIELAFLCDDEEAIFLNSTGNQRQIAKALIEGVVSYFA